MKLPATKSRPPRKQCSTKQRNKRRSSRGETRKTVALEARHSQLERLEARYGPSALLGAIVGLGHLDAGYAEITRSVRQSITDSHSANSRSHSLTRLALDGSGTSTDGNDTSANVRRLSRRSTFRPEQLYSSQSVGPDASNANQSLYTSLTAQAAADASDVSGRASQDRQSRRSRALGVSLRTDLRESWASIWNSKIPTSLLAAAPRRDVALEPTLLLGRSATQAFHDLMQLQ